MFENAWQNGILGLGVSVVGGALVIYFVAKWLHDWVICKAKALGQEFSSEQLPLRVPSMPVWIGILERLAYTLLIVSNVSASAAFIGTWILAKILTGWNRYQSPGVHFRMLAFSGLLLSILSLLFALLGAILWKPEILP